MPDFVHLDVRAALERAAAEIETARQALDRLSGTGRSDSCAGGCAAVMERLDMLERSLAAVLGSQSGCPASISEVKQSDGAAPAEESIGRQGKTDSSPTLAEPTQWVGGPFSDYGDGDVVPMPSALSDIETKAPGIPGQTPSLQEVLAEANEFWAAMQSKLDQDPAMDIGQFKNLPYRCERSGHVVRISRADWPDWHFIAIIGDRLLSVRDRIITAMFDLEQGTLGENARTLTVATIPSSAEIDNLAAVSPHRILRGLLGPRPQ